MELDCKQEFFFSLKRHLLLLEDVLFDVIVIRNVYLMKVPVFFYL